VEILQRAASLKPNIDYRVELYRVFIERFGSNIDSQRKSSILFSQLLLVGNGNLEGTVLNSLD
jgi:hypothetical protein